MQCCICNEELIDYGNNPFPLCDIDNYDDRCCDSCAVYVDKARIMLSRLTQKGLKVTVGDNIVIFHANSSDRPIKCIIESNKFLSGEVTSIEDNNGLSEFRGTWGNFVVTSKDIYALTD